MNKKLKIAIPVVAGILALSTGIGWAAAKSADQTKVSIPPVSYQAATTDNATYPWYCGGFGGPAGSGTGFPVTPQLATLLGTTTADLEAQLSAGKTLAEIASARGISQDQLIQTLMAPYIDHLNIMMKYGYLTQDQVNTMSQQARERMQTMITSTNNNSGWGYMGGMMGRYGGGNRNGPGGPQAQPGTNPPPRSGFGGMMGGYGGGYGGGMMGGYGGGMMGRW